MTEFQKTDDYEDMAATFQVMMIHWLNDALQQAGIADCAKRRDICEKFGFVFGVWTDQYWFTDSNGTKVFPCISFATRGPVTDLEAEELGTLHLPSRLFSFKEYLGGNLDYYFVEHGEDVSDIATGLEDA